MSTETRSESEQREKIGILNGKHALVTGGANGIGRAIVRDFVEEGATVSFFDIDEAGIKRLEEELGETVKGHKVNVTNRGELEKAFQDPGLENIDILVNCAGGGGEYSFDSPDEEAWQQIMDRNFNGSRLVTEYTLPRMLKKAQGSIVFITTSHTAFAFSKEAPYDSAKLALVGLMRNLAIDYGSRGIRVNAVAPGSIYHSGSTGLMSEQEAKELGTKVPLKRLGEPEEVAQVVSFIASDKSSYITGAEIRVDGGQTVQNSLLN